jgi:hypothetical protein
LRDAKRAGTCHYDVCPVPAPRPIGFKSASSLRTAGERAREVAALVADATSQGARAIAEQHAAIRSTTEEEGKRSPASTL